MSFFQKLRKVLKKVSKVNGLDHNGLILVSSVKKSVTITFLYIFDFNNRRFLYILNVAI
jgi:hypothetical protein